MTVVMAPSARAAVSIDPATIVEPSCVWSVREAVAATPVPAKSTRISSGSGTVSTTIPGPAV